GGYCACYSSVQTAEAKAGALHPAQQAQVASEVPPHVRIRRTVVAALATGLPGEALEPVKSASARARKRFLFRSRVEQGIVPRPRNCSPASFALPRVAPAPFEALPPAGEDTQR